MKVLRKSIGAIQSVNSIKRENMVNHGYTLIILDCQGNTVKTMTGHNIDNAVNEYLAEIKDYTL